MPNTILQGGMDLEKMLSHNDFPVKCQECAKSSKPFIYGKCSFCQDLGFQEEVLCYLNRSTQNPASFECHAFQPLLKLVGSSGQETRPEPKARSAEITVEKLLDSDMVKYQRALARQKSLPGPRSRWCEPRPRSAAHRPEWGQPSRSAIPGARW